MDELADEVSVKVDELADEVSVEVDELADEVSVEVGSQMHFKLVSRSKGYEMSDRSTRRPVFFVSLPLLP